MLFNGVVMEDILLEVNNVTQMIQIKHDGEMDDVQILVLQLRLRVKMVEYLDHSHLQFHQLLLDYVRLD